MDKKIRKEKQVDQKKQQQHEEIDYDDEQLPPYTTSNNSASRRNQDPASKYPPQAHHTQAPSRSFKITPKGWASRSLLVLDGKNKDAVLYTAKTTFMSNDVTIHKSAIQSNETNLAEVEYHSFRRKIDVHMHGQTIILPMNSRFNTETALFALPALQQQNISSKKVTWRNEGHIKASEILCLDEKGVCLAKIKTSRWSMRETAELDLFGDSLASDSRAVDEIVATGLAVLHLILRKRRAAGAAAGAAGGGA